MYRSNRTVLICEECGERLVIVGSEKAWRSESAVFECECGERHTLAGRAGFRTAGERTTSELPALNASFLGNRYA